MTTSAFNLLCEELQAFQESRAKQQHAADIEMALTNRHYRRALISRKTKENRQMAKAAPPVDFDRLAKAQDAIAADMAKSQSLHVQDKIRGHIADLRKAAAAGRLSGLEAARLDVFIGQAAAMGLKP